MFPCDAVASHRREGQRKIVDVDPGPKRDAVPAAFKRRKLHASDRRGPKGLPARFTPNLDRVAGIEILEVGRECDFDHHLAF